MKNKKLSFTKFLFENDSDSKSVREDVKDYLMEITNEKKINSTLQINIKKNKRENNLFEVTLVGNRHYIKTLDNLINVCSQSEKTALSAS